jgi:hypothetical protein
LDGRRTDIDHAFEIRFTGYIDAILDDSDLEHHPETRRPPSTRHTNLYQTPDWPRGAPTIDGEENIDVSTWAGGLAHTTIDDNADVQGVIFDRVTFWLSR